MEINKSSVAACLDRLISVPFDRKRDLNRCILNLSASTNSWKKTAKKAAGETGSTFTLNEEQKKEIQKKIRKINQRDFPECFKKRIESITKDLNVFVEKYKERGIECKKTSAPSFQQNQRQTELLSQEESPVEENELLFGIQNKTGNDCYQNSLCQFLECKTLKKEFVDRLPDNLWREFNRRPFHSKALRNLIRKETDFPDDASYRQKDADELLTFLSYKLNLEDTIKNPTPIDHNKILSKQKDETKVEKTFGQKIKSYLLSLIALPFFLWKKTFEFLDHLMKNLESQSEEQVIEHIPLNPIVRGKRKLKSDPNPLECTIFESRKWNVSNVPDEFKTHEYFGGENNETTRSTNQLNVLKLPIHESNNFQTLLENYFEEDENSHEPSSLPQKEPKIQAKYSLRRYYQKEPSSLIFSLSRFRFEGGSSHKNGSEIEGIPATLKLPSKALKGKPAEKELKLQSFIVHLGDSLNSGHYICYRKVEGEWYLFDDGARPEKLSQQEALDASKNAYLIFYDQIET